MDGIIVHNRSLTIVVAARSSWRVNSLSAVIAAIPGVTIAGRVQDTAALLTRITVGGVNVVVLDASMTNGDVPAIIGRIKAASPTTASIVIAQYRHQRQVANEAGADAVLIDGFRTETLTDILQHLSCEIKFNEVPGGETESSRRADEHKDNSSETRLRH